MTATLTLADPATERVARLPLSALYSQGGDPSLYIVDDTGDVALKPVTVKSYESNNVVITGGVDEGAKVVALGVQKLDPAQKVRVVSSCHLSFSSSGIQQLVIASDLEGDDMKRFNLSGWAVSHPR